VERLSGSDSQQFLVYSPELRGFLTHFVAGRNVPCFGDDSLCEGGCKTANLRENFLLHAWSLKRSRQVFIYLTPGAAEQIIDQIAPGGSLRGRMLRLTRSRTDKGRLRAELGELAEGLKSIPPEKDFMASALNLLKWRGQAMPTADGPEQPRLRVAK